MPDTKVSLRDNADQVRNVLTKYEGQIADLIMANEQAARRFVQISIDAAIHNPKLLEPHPATRFSLVGAILECATLRLDPGTAGQCWILPFWNNRKKANIATFVLGYRGAVQLNLRSSRVSNIWANVVWDCDEFDYTFAPTKLHHKPVRLKDGSEPQREQMVAAYAVARAHDGQEQWEVMERYEIERIESSSPSAKSQTSPWKSERDRPAMFAKCPIKRLHKVLPLSIDHQLIERAVNIDNRADVGLPQRLELNLDNIPGLGDDVAETVGEKPEDDVPFDSEETSS